MNQDMMYDPCEPVPQFKPLRVSQMSKIDEFEEYWRVWQLKGWYSDSEGWFWRDAEVLLVTVLSIIAIIVLAVIWTISAQ